MVVAQSPHMSAKLIIAEASGARDALNALVLLKVTGHVTGRKGARLNIVPLAESINDLAELENAVKQLLSDKVYRAHAQSLGQQIVMVAESDNRRRDGFSAGENINETIGRLIKLSDDVDLPIMVMNGGGASQMRGAQKRATEIGFAQAYEAKKWNAHNLYQPLFTVQGHQARLLFSPLSVAAYMVEGILSQNIYAKAGMEAQIEAFAMTPDKKRRQDIARHDEQLYHKRARAAFRKLSKDPSIDALMSHAPWVSIIAGNASSRPSKRGGKDQQENTPAREFIFQEDGSVKKALEQRAITGDNLARSFGILPLPFLGQREGFEAMLYQGRARHSHLGSVAEIATNTFNNSKPFRDHARSLAITLALTNFDKAWSIVAGVRPSDAAVVDLAAGYADGVDSLKSPEQTLAFLEVYASDTAKLLYYALSGRLPVAEKAFYAPHSVLRAFWPELAWHIERRQRQLGFANFVESKLTVMFNKALDKAVDPATYRLAQATQASVALNNTPIGMIATFTAKDRINEPTWGEAAAREEIRTALKPSPALAELAKGQDLPGAEKVNF
jgi:phosphoenolpyruvate carboxylase